MRIGYAAAVAALLAGSPAMAQVVIGTPDNGAAQQHQNQADQDRALGRENMDAARQQAAMGNYGAAQQDQQQAHQDWHAAHRQEHAADRDSSGGVVVQLGH